MFVVCYDLPCRFNEENGRGVFTNKKPLYLISKLIKSGLVERIQNSVLLTDEPAVAYQIAEAVERAGGHAFVFTVYKLEEFGESLKIKTILKNI